MSLYRYTGNANPADHTEALVTDAGRIELAGPPLEMTEAQYQAVPKRYILDKVEDKDASDPKAPADVSSLETTAPDPELPAPTSPSTPSAPGSTSTPPAPGK